MMIILPKKIDGLAAMKSSSPPTISTSGTPPMQRQPVQVFLPRFTMTSSFELSKPLGEMGMTDAFTRDCRFHRHLRLSLQKAQHQRRHPQGLCGRQ